MTTVAAEPGALRIGIARMAGVVVVDVHGHLDQRAVAQLHHVLEDLIDGQGNLSIVVDLRDAASGDAASAPLFSWAVDRAARHGGTLVLSEPPVPLYHELERRGVGGLSVTRPPAARPDGRRAGSTTEGADAMTTTGRRSA
jgi:anti-anti-sigma regulatory factor